MLSHTSTFETLAKAPVKTTDVIVVRQSGELGSYTDDLTAKWTSSTTLMSVGIDALGEMLGTTTKKAVVKLLGIVSGVSAGQLFQIKLGLYNSATSTFDYVSQGFFLVDNVDYDYEANSSTVTMYDRMWVAGNQLYEDRGNSLVYPATVESLAGQVAAFMNLTLMANFGALPNSQYLIAEDLYAEISNATIQNVIQDIAGATGTTARISDNTLSFVQFTPNTTSPWTVVQTVSGSNASIIAGASSSVFSITGVTPGNSLIFVATGSASSATPSVALTDSQSNTWSTIASPTNLVRATNQWTLFGKAASVQGGSTTITMSITGTSWGAGQWYIMEVSGLDSSITASTYDSTPMAGWNNGGGATYGLTLPSFTTTQNKDLFVLMGQDIWNGQVVTDASFTTVAYVPAGTNISLLVRDTGTAGSKTYTVSGLTQQKYNYAGVTFKSASQGIENLTSAELKTLKIGGTYGPITSVVLGRVPTNDNVAISASNPPVGTITGVNATTNILTIVGHGMETGNMVRVKGAGT